MSSKVDAANIFYSWKISPSRRGDIRFFFVYEKGAVVLTSENSEIA